MRGQASINAWPSIAALAVLASAASLVLTSGSGGVVMVGGEPVRTGPVPVWLVEALYSPPDAMWPVVVGMVVAVAALSTAGYMRHGIDDKVKREALDNVLVVASMGGATLAAAAVLPYWAAVGAGSVAGFALSVPLRGWLGL